MAAFSYLQDGPERGEVALDDKPPAKCRVAASLAMAIGAGLPATGTSDTYNAAKLVLRTILPSPSTFGIECLTR